MEDILKERNEFIESNKDLINKRTTWTPNDVLVFDKYAEIILRDKKQNISGITMIDIESVDLIKKYKWHMTKRGYCSTQYKGKEIKLHRLLISAKKGEIVDHINRNKLDNRMENLRIMDLRESQLNRNRRVESVPVFVQ